MSISKEVRDVVKLVVREREQPSHLAEKIVKGLEEMATVGDAANTDELMRQRLAVLFKAVQVSTD